MTLWQRIKTWHRFPVGNCGPPEQKFILTHYGASEQRTTHRQMRPPDTTPNDVRELIAIVVESLVAKS